MGSTMNRKDLLALLRSSSLSQKVLRVSSVPSSGSQSSSTQVPPLPQLKITWSSPSRPRTSSDGEAPKDGQVQEHGKDTVVVKEGGASTRRLSTNITSQRVPVVNKRYSVSETLGRRVSTSSDRAQPGARQMQGYLEGIRREASTPSDAGARQLQGHLEGIRREASTPSSPSDALSARKASASFGAATSFVRAKSTAPPAGLTGLMRTKSGKFSVFRQKSQDPRDDTPPLGTSSSPLTALRRGSRAAMPDDLPLRERRVPLTQKDIAETVDEILNGTQGSFRRTSRTSISGHDHFPETGPRNLLDPPEGARNLLDPPAAQVDKSGNFGGVGGFTPIDDRLVKKLLNWRNTISSRKDKPRSESQSVSPDAEEQEEERQTSPSKESPLRKAWEVGREYPVIEKRLSFLILHAKENTSGHADKAYVTSEWPELYEALAADFGPVNLGVVHDFCNWMEKKFKLQQEEERLSGCRREIVYYLSENTAHQTNAAFLIATYLVTKMQWTPDRAWAPFGCIKPSPFAPYPDASFAEEAASPGCVEASSFPQKPQKSEEGFHLPVLTCLQGVAMALKNGFYNPDTFDHDVYSHLGRREAEDLHFCTPTLAAFSAPSRHSEQVSPWASSKTATDYASLFASRGIRDVVTLSNDSDEYGAWAFTAQGVRHRSLSYGSSHPPFELVEAFINIMNDAPGAVAVHCSDGRGRTGALLGVYLMIQFRCSAKKAIGWLRVVRPGCVTKDGQEYLFWVEEMLAAGRPLQHPPLTRAERKARLQDNMHSQRCAVVETECTIRLQTEQALRQREKEGERLVTLMAGNQEEKEVRSGGGLMQPPLDLPGAATYGDKLATYGDKSTALSTLPGIVAPQSGVPHRHASQLAAISGRRSSGGGGGGGGESMVLRGGGDERRQALLGTLEEPAGNGSAVRRGVSAEGDSLSRYVREPSSKNLKGVTGGGKGEGEEPVSHADTRSAAARSRSEGAELDLALGTSGGRKMSALSGSEAHDYLQPETRDFGSGSSGHSFYRTMR